MNYQPIIGLEVHIELNTKSKMFCSCPNDPNERRPNVNICPICTAQPGTLPVINKEAVRKVIKTGLALNCQIPEYSKFDRKNYFYPDLPKGYQISQEYMPLCRGGFLRIDNKKIRIRNIHLEEDTGKLIHFEGTDYSLVDFNRAGIPLMELVTEPDLRSAKEARKFAEELQLILRYLSVSSADMEKGQLRVEVNISLSQNTKLGTKVEIKNLNSFRAVKRGINYEIERQTKILKSGKKVIQETRGWLDEATASSRRVAGARVADVRGVTVGQREKEEAHDYRYFPEPDLPPLHIKEEFINEIKAEIPELPQQKRERFKREYGLDEKNTEVFVQNKDFGEYFEKVVSEFGPRLSREKLSGLIKLATNYLITDLQGLLKGARVLGEDFLITPENFAEFITLIYTGAISSKIAKQVLGGMFSTGADPTHIIEEKGLSQITDEAEIGKIIKKVISKNPKAVQDFKKGKETAIQFLIGQIMAQTKGKANPQIVRDILDKHLTKLK
ncbi:MAG: Asp-tRNA(Asn)/Glu-tRNA(Gln) amidotransferase subunit GatB [Candidatus Pacebacteria bacterium]|nr:Asp-tRNA(Asn)/Glu-tRNA(Gln) amidotransferase subunit GatB [Candidatus Paceibacterota bacterium]